MELRGQDKRITGGGGGGLGIPSNFTYGFTSIISATGGVGVGGTGERRSNNNNNNNNTGTGNGTVRSTLIPTQTLDQFHHNLPQLNHNRSLLSPQPQPQPQQQPQPQSSSREVLRDEDSDPDPSDPDPVPVDASTTTTTATTIIRYKECLKNHAASIGGHVMDGCGEFMPSSEEGTLGSLKCAACDCHRSFHRKEIEGEPASQSVTNCYFCYNRNNKTDTKTRALPPPQGPQQPPPPPPPPPSATIQHHQKFSSKLPNSHQAAGPNQPMMMTFGSGGGTDQSSSEEFNVYQSNVGPGHHQHPSLQQQPYTTSSKKRFRTKFSQEQKEKMAEFAEKIGWRISKPEEAAVQQFCVEVGVKRQVLKVWMHNNKHISTKKKLEDRGITSVDVN